MLGELGVPQVELLPGQGCSPAFLWPEGSPAQERFEGQEQDFRKSWGYPAEPLDPVGVSNPGPGRS